uniref:Uncharacterized protein n=1 Tax=Gouania willdenowi TaxID=441366 RepID=A0A8C5D501_GOUWI
ALAATLRPGAGSRHWRRRWRPGAGSRHCGDVGGLVRGAGTGGDVGRPGAGSRHWRRRWRPGGSLTGSSSHPYNRSSLASSR